MQRWKFSREFKLKAVKLIRERGITVAQPARNMTATLRLEFGAIPEWVVGLFPGQTKTPGFLEPGVIRSVVAGTRTRRCNTAAVIDI